jgi:hypothetical protein
VPTVGLVETAASLAAASSSVAGMAVSPVTIISTSGPTSGAGGPSPATTSEAVTHLVVVMLGDGLPLLL